MFQNIRQKRNYAASRIQKAWRGSHNKHDILYLIKAFRNKNATLIQRYIRGYMVSQNLIIGIRREKLKQNLDHFDTIRNEIHTEAAILI